MKINMKRLMSNLYEIGDMGKTEEGYNRIEFSREYFEAAELFLNKLKKSGLKAWIDDVGNVIGERPGTDSDLPYIIIGSHLDTVRNGGLYDGALGVVCAFECIEILEEENIKMRHPLRIVAFNAEEGLRLGGTFGSIAIFGTGDIEKENNLEELPELGLTMKNIRDSKWEDNKIGAYLELHIEQGDQLNKSNKTIGIVNGIVGIERYRIKINGESNHGGTTSMESRKDAVKTMGEVITYMYSLCEKYPHPFVFTIGDIQVSPACYNVIPEYAELFVEIRDLNRENIDSFITDIKKFSEKYNDTKIEFFHVLEKKPYMLNKEIRKIIETVCIEKDISFMELSSGAGHDAMCMPEDKPAAMIFVPSKDGVSHNKKEFTSEYDIETGTLIMYLSLLGMDAEI
ncbi:hydantoinase/carbamoylase family amidase [Sebaldella sp. S0638]|uniref:hydantoinase/carbamoylase family amidase n=1 Tax=Sebaldella sp. S0638 TaxID=2957809 RepID=UPI0020A0FAFE|nr:hydantoinase/carbamoylase family amidase [Sebaldella sp. S0638]MCP1224966.1 hydantoinase/carbamoylase family amidase [Sebaldella sp. S0638]